MAKFLTDPNKRSPHQPPYQGGRWVSPGRWQAKKIETMTLNFLPPQNWQDFENFVKGTVEVIWKQEGWQIYGRSGQKQSGIDIYGYDNSRNFVGIQCKKKSQTNSEGELLKNSLITKSLINDEIISAKKISSPKLDKLIIATTSSRDTNVQDIIREANDKEKDLKIEIWFGKIFKF